MTAPLLGDLDHVELNDGVNDAGLGFVSVRATGHKGRQPITITGQLTPAEVRTMALAWVSVAEAAEQDAATLSVVRDLGLPDELAGAVIVKLRANRTDADQ